MALTRSPSVSIRLEDAAPSVPVLAAVFVMIAFGVIAKNIDLSQATLPVLGKPPTYFTYQVAVARDKVAWGTSWLLLAAVMAWNAALCALLLFRQRAEIPKNHRVLLAAISAAGLAVTFYWLSGNSAGGGDIKQLIDLVEKHVGEGWRLTNAGNILIAFVAALTACAASSLAFKPAGPRLQALRIANRWLMLALYSAAALLVCGLLQLHSLFQLGATLSGEAESLVSLVKMMTLCGGLLFSTLLVAIYAPVMLVQQGWLTAERDLAREAAEQAGAIFKPEEWETHNGFTRSPLQTATTFASIVAPFAGALITSWMTVSK